MIELIHLMTISVSALTFMLLNQKLVQLFKPKTVEENEYKCWKWNNILTSLFHSFVVGFGVLNV